MSKPKSTMRRVPAATNHKEVEQELRLKVRDLELEVKTLKNKLDELRKAKNTTLIKKEKEFITTGVPQRDTPADEPTGHRNEDVTKIQAQYQSEIEKLKNELVELTLSSNAPAPDCGHEEIIMALQNRLSDIESMNTALTMQNDQLQETLSQAYSDISVKEAEHCEAQETMKKELQIKWQEMYKEWMRTTEAKIIELQAANDMMRRMLASKPSE